MDDKPRVLATVSGYLLAWKCCPVCGNASDSGHGPDCMFAEEVECVEGAQGGTEDG